MGHDGPHYVPFKLPLQRTTYFGVIVEMVRVKNDVQYYAVVRTDIGQ